MKIIDMHTHAQDILFLPGEGTHLRPSLGILIRLFELQKFRWITPEPLVGEGMLYRLLRRWTARDTQARNAMAGFESLKREMEQNSITHSVVLPIEPYSSTTELISYANRDKSLIPFASVDPNDPNRVEKLRKYAESGCRGLKLHPIIQDFHPSGPECMETVEEFSQYDLPVFFHSGQTAYYLPESESESYGLPENYVKTIEAFPKVRFVMGHMGMFQSSKVIEITQEHENVYFDTSFQPIGMVKRAIEKVGEESLMFGSDWPFGRQKFELAVIMKLTDGNQSLREKLFWKNAESLIGRVD
jgi:predicted TIM-barrel fold metal-dependent hydrolase